MFTIIFYTEIEIRYIFKKQVIQEENICSH